MLTVDDRPGARTTTAVPSRPSKTAASTPSAAAAKPKPVSTPVDKALDAAGLKGAAAEAKKGANEVVKAVKEQPTVERAVAVGVYKTGEAAVKTAAAAAGDVGTKAVEVAKPVVAAVTRPTVREVKEAGREITAAGKDIVDTASANAAELRKEVGAAWKDQPTIERKVAVAGYEILENHVQGTVRQAGSLLNGGKEILEGAAEIAINNPANTMVIAGGKATVDGAVNAGRAIAGWFGDRISGGAAGAVEASKTASNTGSSIAERTQQQVDENRREVGGAASKFGAGWIDSLNPFDGDEVKDAWEDQPTIERKVAVAAYESAEDAVQNGVRNVTNLANLGQETAEAAAQSVVTNVQNTGDAIAGGLDAAGDFLGGLFG
jgi:hypothetical protein